MSLFALIHPRRENQYRSGILCLLRFIYFLSIDYFVDERNKFCQFFFYLSRVFFPALCLNRKNFGFYRQIKTLRQREVMTLTFHGIQVLRECMDLACGRRVHSHHRKGMGCECICPTHACRERERICLK